MESEGDDVLHEMVGELEHIDDEMGYEGDDMRVEKCGRVSLRERKENPPLPHGSTR